MSSLIQDLRHGLRLLVKSPGFTLAAIVGPRARDRREHRDLQRRRMGCSSSRCPTRTPTVSSGSGTCRRPTPFPARRRSPFPSPTSSTGKSRATSFEKMASIEFASLNLTGGGRARGQSTPRGSPRTSSPCLGVAAASSAGPSLPPENVPGAGHVVILSHDFWKTRFGGDPADRRTGDPVRRRALARGRRDGSGRELPAMFDGLGPHGLDGERACRTQQPQHEVVSRG